MSWRTTAVLALILAGLSAAYFLRSPKAAPTDYAEPPVSAREFDRIEIERGNTTVVLESTGSEWFVTQPIHRRADAYKLQAMVSGLRFVPERWIKPGDATPEVYGVDPARLTVRAFSAGQSFTLRFGNDVPTSPQSVYVKVGGREEVFVTLKEAREAFEATAYELRDRRIAAFDAPLVSAMTARRRYVRATEAGPVTEVEEFEVAFDGSPDRRGWMLTKPHEERLDDVRTISLFSQLSALRVTRWQPMDEAASKALAEPEIEFVLTVHQKSEPIRLCFAPSAAEPTEVLVRANGEDDYAVIARENYDRMPRDFNALRTDNPYDFQMEQIESIRVSSAHGAMVLKADRTAEQVKWVMVEPSTVSIDPSGIEALVAQLLSIRGLGYVPAQEDLTAFGLNPPMTNLTFTIRRGEETLERTYRLGRVGESEEGFLKKDWAADLMKVPGRFVYGLSLLELNLQGRGVLRIPPEAFTGFGFEWKEVSGESLELRLKRGVSGWEYTDERHLAKGAKPDPKRVEEVLNVLGAVDAELYIGRGDEAVRKYKLGSGEAAGKITLEFDYHGTPQVEILWVGENLGRPTQPVHYARREGSTVVFRIGGGMLQELRADVHERPKPEGDGDGHDH